MPSKKVASRALTEEQVSQLKSEGVLSIGNQLQDIGLDTTFDKVEKIEYVLNATDSIVSIGDIETFSGRGLAIPPRSLIFMPHYATQEKIKRSAGLRNSVVRAKSLRLIENPVGELTTDDVTPQPSMEDTLAPGEHLDSTENPFDGVLDEIERKEEAFDERMTGRGRTGRRQRVKK